MVKLIHENAQDDQTSENSLYSTFLASEGGERGERETVLPSKPLMIWSLQLDTDCQIP